MKLTHFLIPFFLAGCSPELSSQNPVYKAIPYIGKTETQHRQFLKEYTGVDPVRTEWCAAFVNAVLNESGIPGSESVSDVPLMARSFLQWGDEISKEEIQAGDIVVLPRGDVGWQGHVGFYIKTNVINGRIYYAILGGNQSNKVSIENYAESRVLGIRRIKQNKYIEEQNYD